jgi:type I restriction enzyme S subunit
MNIKSLCQSRAREQQYKALKASVDTLPQALLYKAFKGELSEQLGSDGDARELLKKIQALKKTTKKPKKTMTKKTKNYPENEGVLGMVAEK